jgi:aminopeptidase YwaD
MERSTITQQIDAQRMMLWIEELSSLGPRIPGAPGDAASRHFLMRVAAAMGLRAWTAPCRVLEFRTGEGSVTTTVPERRMAALPQDRSAATPAGGLEAEIVYVGCGAEEDYAGIDARGRFVLQDIWGVHMLEKIRVAKEQGAVGCVWMHSAPGGKRSAWGLPHEPCPLPVVCVSYEDGHWLKELIAKSTLRVRVEAPTVVKPGLSDHVFIEAPSANGCDDTVLLIAHRDTTNVSSGANDNGSGIAVSLELLRAFAHNPLPYRLVTMFSTAEEGGGLGVAQYADRMMADLPGLKAIINLDMFAVGGPLHIVTGDARYRTNAHLNELLRQSATEQGYSITNYQNSMGLADVTSIVTCVPSTWLFKPDDPRFHTDQDLPEFVNPNDLKAAADIVAGALLSLPAAGWPTN